MRPRVPFLAALRGFRIAFVAVWRDPETKALPVVVGVLLVSGTMFYWSVEDWTLVQSLYFSVVTLATVGYGDLTPTSDFSRIFTIIYTAVRARPPSETSANAEVSSSLAVTPPGATSSSRRPTRDASRFAFAGWLRIANRVRDGDGGRSAR